MLTDLPGMSIAHSFMRQPLPGFGYPNRLPPSNVLLKLFFAHPMSDILRFPHQTANPSRLRTNCARPFSHWVLSSLS